MASSNTDGSGTVASPAGAFASSQGNPTPGPATPSLPAEEHAEVPKVDVDNPRRKGESADTQPLDPAGIQPLADEPTDKPATSSNAASVQNAVEAPDDGGLLAYEFEELAAGRRRCACPHGCERLGDRIRGLTAEAAVHLEFVAPYPGGWHMMYCDDCFFECPDCHCDRVCSGCANDKSDSKDKTEEKAKT